MMQFLALAAILMIGGAAEEAKLSIAKANPEIQDLESEPSKLESVLEDAYFGSESNRIWDTRKARGDKLSLSEEENRIVQDVFSPDYYEPTTVLDFRYLKSGGRGYTRSDGGQILILPKRHNSPVIHNNYDTLIEFLRLKHLEETERKLGKYLRHNLEDKDGSRRGPDVYYDYLEDIDDDYNSKSNTGKGRARPYKP